MTAVVVSSQRSSPPAEPFSLSTQYEQYGYECHTNQGLRSTEIRTLQPTGNKNTQERTADAKPPFIYIGSFREVGGRTHSSQNYLTAKNLK